MLVESVTVLDGVDGNHLVPPAVDVFQPQQQAVTHLVEVLRIRRVEPQESNLRSL